MSGEASGKVLRMELATSTERLILVALADAARSDGSNIILSRDYIAWMCDVDPQTVKRVIKKYKANGILIQTGWSKVKGNITLPIYAFNYAKVTWRDDFREWQALHGSSTAKTRWRANRKGNTPAETPAETPAVDPSVTPQNIGEGGVNNTPLGDIPSEVEGGVGNTPLKGVGGVSGPPLGGCRTPPHYGNENGNVQKKAKIEVDERLEAPIGAFSEKENSLEGTPSDVPVIGNESSQPEQVNGKPKDYLDLAMANAEKVEREPWLGFLADIEQTANGIPIDPNARKWGWHFAQWVGYLDSNGDVMDDRIGETKQTNKGKDSERRFWLATALNMRNVAMKILPDEEKALAACRDVVIALSSGKMQWKNPGSFATGVSTALHRVKAGGPAVANNAAVGAPPETEALLEGIRKAAALQMCQFSKKLGVSEAQKIVDAGVAPEQMAAYVEAYLKSERTNGRPMKVLFADRLATIADMGPQLTTKATGPIREGDKGFDEIMNLFGNNDPEWL